MSLAGISLSSLLSRVPTLQTLKERNEHILSFAASIKHCENLAVVTGHESTFFP
jgi:hypothetical protein